MGKASAEIQVDMTATINLDAYSVSRHMFDRAKLCVVDIDPNTIVDRSAFVAAVKADKRRHVLLLHSQGPGLPS